LTVVDTADGEKFQSLTAHYYRRTNIVLLVCSLDDEVTLTRLTKWYRDSLYYVDEHDIVYAVCGLKCDLPDYRKEVTLEMMQRFARHVEFPEGCVFEVSAKTGEGVDNMLVTLCSTAVDRIRRNTPIAEPAGLQNSGESSMLLNGDPRYNDGRPEHEVQSQRRCCKCVIL
jgi:GTPase SAR1 family protein